jgi:hypothetical protein
MTDKHTFDAVAFRLQFPYFASDTKYPDEQLSGYFTVATVHIYPYDWGVACGDTLQRMLDLMTAHLAFRYNQLLQGNTSVGALTGATIDKVTVSMQVPAALKGWQAWLLLSPFGMELWGLISAIRPRALAVGGLPERQGFRRVGGGFGGPGRWLR